jgi:hypothetical protein
MLNTRLNAGAKEPVTQVLVLALAGIVSNGWKEGEVVLLFTPIL